MRAAYDPAPRRPLSGGERLGASLFALLLVSLLAAELLSGGDPRKLSVICVMVSWYPLIAIHELGHALCARAVGWHVHEIVLGFGPELVRLRALGARMIVRLIPAGGYVVPSPNSLQGARAKSALVYAAGPAAELAAALLMLAWLGSDTLLSQSDDIFVIAAQSFALAAVMGAAINLLPTAAAGAASDGLGILLSVGVADDQFTYQMARPHMQEAERRIDAGDPDGAVAVIAAAESQHPDSPFLTAMRARCLAAKGEHDDAMRLLEQLREQPKWSDLVESERLHAAARVALASHDRTLLPDAETACRAALERTPGAPDILVTLGVLLLEQGRYLEAETQLQTAYKSTREPALEDRCLANLSRAARGLGNDRDERLYREAFEARCKRQ